MMMNLEEYDDDGLKALIAEAETVLAERERRRRDETVRQIRALAEDAGLAVEVKPRKKRGRPRKKKSAAGGTAGGNG
ncbi:MAG: hypothetical protein FKY71_07780 [Spiribacter salinus]|uniref:H-NS histone family protein n=1 Tax=Spiribacter salinus TaxID=1335746 RepID=A0A540VS65_9GAMM|nr:MAG: hypothetical protein FKY71_07780 [Spiribacter salinus]